MSVKLGIDVRNTLLQISFNDFPLGLSTILDLAIMSACQLRQKKVVLTVETTVRAAFSTFMSASWELSCEFSSSDSEE